MVFTFALLVFTIPILCGWGRGAVWLLGKVGVKSPYGFDVLEPVIGLGIASLFVNLLNFLIPVSYAFALGFAVVGWLLFLVFVARIFPALKQPFWVFLGAVWLATISTQAVLQAWNYDSGLYHIPAVRWLVDTTVPFGLANLHGRLGFNSAWFSSSALLAEVTSPFTPNYTALASEAFLAVFGLAGLLGLYRFVTEKERDLANLFLVVSMGVGLAPVVGQNLSSPSTDHPVLLLTLLIAYVFLRAVQAQEKSSFLYEFWLSSFLIAFVITIKISMLPLALVQIVLFVWGYKKYLHVPQWRNLLPAVATAALVFGTWVVRGLALSGCLIYPISVTCIFRLPWAVTPAQAENEARWILSWARTPNASPERVLANWDWVGPWFQRLTGSQDFIFPIVFIVVGLVVILVAWRQIRTRREFSPILWLGGIAVVGMLYWFFSAPDLRFGASWFWLAGVSALSLAIWVVAANPNLLIVLRVAAVVLLLGAGLAVANVGTSYMERAGWTWQSQLYVIPPMSKANTVQVIKTDQGIEMAVVPEARCFWLAEFCTPYFEPKLYIERTASNRLFFYPPR